MVSIIVIAVLAGIVGLFLWKILKPKKKVDYKPTTGTGTYTDGDGNPIDKDGNPLSGPDYNKPRDIEEELTDENGYPIDEDGNRLTDDQGNLLP
jgi:hypothetical protein